MKHKQLTVLAYEGIYDWSAVQSDLIVVNCHHLLLGQYLRPSLKGSCHQPTKTTPVSPGAQNACKYRKSVIPRVKERKNKILWGYLKSVNIKEKHTPNGKKKKNYCTNLPWWDIFRHSFQHRNIASLDVQNTKHRTALTNQSLSPVLMEDKLLPLQEEDGKI